MSHPPTLDPIPYAGRGTPRPQPPIHPDAARSLRAAAMFFLTPIPCLIAIHHGVNAVRATRQTRQRGYAHGWWGVALGFLGLCGWVLVCVGIANVREAMAGIDCSSHSRQLGQAILIYSQDHAGALPPHWEALLGGATGVDPNDLVCRASGATPARGATPQSLVADFQTGNHCSYAYLGGGYRETDFSDDDVLVFEVGSNHRGGKTMVLFADGHGAMMSPLDAQAAVQRTLDHLTRVTRRATLPATIPSLLSPTRRH